MHLAFCAMIIVQNFISPFNHKPDTDNFYERFLIRALFFLVWCYTMICLLGTFYYKIFFFKCRERLIQSWCILLVDILPSPCGQILGTSVLPWVTCWPKKWSFLILINYEVQLLRFSASLSRVFNKLRWETCLNCASWTGQDQVRSPWVKNTMSFPSWCCFCKLKILDSLRENLGLKTTLWYLSLYLRKLA